MAISLIFSILFSSNNNLLILITLIALPITLYSIYYQFSVVKKWCPLCLGIVAVLWLQGLCLLLNKPFLTNPKFDIGSGFILFFSFLLITSLWSFIKPLLKKQQDLEKLEIEHFKFKRNFDLFNAVYSKSEKIDISIDTTNEIVLGNKNAALKYINYYQSCMLLLQRNT